MLTHSREAINFCQIIKRLPYDDVGVKVDDVVPFFEISFKAVKARSRRQEVVRYYRLEPYKEKLKYHYYETILIYLPVFHVQEEDSLLSSLR